MRPGGGAGKGASYEREICERLSAWVSDGKRQDLFWRSAMSGGRANLRQRRKRAGAYAAHSGDITATHKGGNILTDRFCIDSKHWRDFELWAPAFGKKEGAFLKAWRKLLKESKKFNKHPMLIGRQNRKGEFVALTWEGYRWLDGGSSEKDSNPVRAIICVPGRLYSGAAYFVSLDDLVKHVSFKRLRSFTERVRIE